MLKTVYRIGFLAAAIVVAGYFSGVNAQSVSGSIAGGSVTRGSTARATVVLSLPAGLHANSNRPGSEYQIPTTVRATSSAGVTMGAVSYPRGRNRKFGFSDQMINVYEGRTSFGFNVKVPSTFRGRVITVNVAVKYQACTNEVCYSPKTKNVKLTAKVN